MPARRAAFAATTVGAGLISVLVAGPALAACDAYSGKCTEPPRVLPKSQTSGTAVSPAVVPSTLPFTGGELVLVSVAGAGALAGGAALVVAGRRRGDARA